MAMYGEFGSIVFGYAAFVAGVLGAAIHCVLLLFRRFRTASSRAQVGFLWVSLLLLLVLPVTIVAVASASVSPSRIASSLLSAAMYEALPLLLASAVTTRVVSRAGA